jgi:osmoprotectant transport system permease protein
MDVFANVWDYLLDGASWTGSGGMLDLLAEQLLLSITALLIALVVALPIACWLGHIGRGGFLAVSVSNIGRAVPTLALLAILVRADWPGPAYFGPYGRAGLATLIALALFALPPLITQTYVAVREVPADTKEAAVGLGMSGWQLFRRVELPLALPLVVSGIRLALVQVWATATIAALVAGPGLGNVITAGFANQRYGQGIAGAVVVAVVALLLEVVGALVARRFVGQQGRTADPSGRREQLTGH